jgi:hypothetical protein
MPWFPPTASSAVPSKGQCETNAPRAATEIAHAAENRAIRLVRHVRTVQATSFSLLLNLGAHVDGKAAGFTESRRTDAFSNAAVISPFSGE